MSEKETAYRINSFSRALLGFVVGVVLVFFALTNFDFGTLHISLMFLPVGAIFYWPVKSSYSLSLILIFLLGLFQDIVSGSPLGVWTLSYLCLFMVAASIARTKHSFSKGLAGFAVSIGFIFILVYIFGYIALGQWPNISSLLTSAVATLITFPLIFWAHSLFSSLRYETPAQEIS